LRTCRAPRRRTCSEPWQRQQRRRRDTQAEQPPRKQGNPRLAARGVKHHHRTRVDEAVHRERDQASSPACFTVRPHQVVGMLVGRHRRDADNAEHGQRGSGCLDLWKSVLAKTGHLSAPQKWRSLLACLLLQAGHLVSTESLISELWADDPPAKANNLVSIYVHRLRRLIGDADGRTLVYRAPGYMLQVADGATDVRRLEIMIRRAREALALGDPGIAAAHLHEALSPWRGQPLEDVAPSARTNDANPTPRRTANRRDRTQNRRKDRVRRARRGDSDLRSYLAEHPVREGLWLLLMRALHKADRRTEALAAYGQAREVFSQELGVDPGAVLIRMYAEIAADDYVSQ
jgi:DNA-binding SARP family transcriptional activator